MLESLIFNMLAGILFIIIFFKFMRKTDATYLVILIIEAIGIAIGLIEMKLGIMNNFILQIIRYLLSIILPAIIIILENKGINVAEVATITIVKLYMMTGDTKNAKIILVKLVTKYPESYLSHKLLAEVYEKEGGMRRAIEEYVTAIDINKKDYKSYYKIAELLRDLGKKDEAIEMLQNLVKTKPDCYEASCLLGELLAEQERFKEAANVYNEALIYKPGDFDLYYNLGIIYTRLSDFQTAKEMYERAASINHKMYGLNYQLALIAFIQRDYDTAEKYLQNSLYDELEAASYYQLAKIYIYKGEKDKAITFLNKAIELENRFLKLAEKENAFISIREHITVSVKMDEPEKEEDDENKEKENSNILKEQEKKAMEYLEESARLIEAMSEVSSKQRIEEKIDYIFNKEKRKKEYEEINTPNKDFMKNIRNYGEQNKNLY